MDKIISVLKTKKGIAGCAAALLLLVAIVVSIVSFTGKEVTISLSEQNVEMDIHDQQEITSVVAGSNRKLVWKSQDETIATVEDGVITAVKEGKTAITASIGRKSVATCFVNVVNSHNAPVILLDHSDIALGLKDTYDVNVRTMWKGEEVDEPLTYTWALQEGSSEKVASFEVSESGATFTGEKYGMTKLVVSTEYRGVVLAKELVVKVCNLDISFDVPNLKLGAGVYTADLGMLKTASDVTSILPEISVYNKGVLVENPDIKWTYGDEAIASMAADWTISAQGVGTTTFVGEYDNSQLYIDVNVYHSKVSLGYIPIESLKSYQITVPNLAGKITDVLYNGVSVLKKYSGNTIVLLEEKLPKIGASAVSGELVIITEKAKYTAESDVVTMAIDNEAELRQFPKYAQKYPDGHFVLTKDIVCVNTYEAAFTEPFIGIFDGKGHAIFNLKTVDNNESNHGFFGKQLGVSSGVGGTLRNIAFVNAEHNGKGGFIAYANGGTLENVYIQVAMKNTSTPTWNSASSVLGSDTYGAMRVKKVFIDYVNYLDNDAQTGRPVWAGYHGKNTYKGLYAVGVDTAIQKLMNPEKSAEDDEYAAYKDYDKFLKAGLDFSSWENDFWSVASGIPYPKSLKGRGGVPKVTVPSVVEAGTNVELEGVTIYDKLKLSSNAAQLGIKLKGSTLIIPSNVPGGTQISVTATSIFKSSDRVVLPITIRQVSSVKAPNTSVVEVGTSDTININLSGLPQLQNATLHNVTYGVQKFETMSYANGTLTLDTDTLGDAGTKSVVATFLTGSETIEVEIPIMLCTYIIDNEAELNRLPEVIVANEGTGYYALGADIYCTGTYPANFRTPFLGVFDGCGHAIYSMSTEGIEGSKGSNGMFGQNFGNSSSDDGTLRNIAFINAKHASEGGFIATFLGGNIENVYIQIGVERLTTTASGNFRTSVLGSATYGRLKTKNVFIEYTTPLTSGNSGTPLIEIHRQYGSYNGLYAVGSAAAYQKFSSSLGSSTAVDDIAGFATYRDFLAAGKDLSGWDTSFWTITNGIPYPKNLPAREGAVPNVSAPETADAGSAVAITGMGMFDQIVLSSEATALGVTVTDNKVNIPDTVAGGTKVKVSVQSVLNSSKKKDLNITVTAVSKITLNDVPKIGKYDADSFTVDLSAAKDAIGTSSLIEVLVNDKAATGTGYEASTGVLTVSNSALTSPELTSNKQKIAARFYKDGIITEVALDAEVYTMIINDAAELNRFATVAKTEPGGCYILGNNITYSGTYAPNHTVMFEGVFDGQGYAIYNLTIADGPDNAFFGAYLGKAGTHVGTLRNIAFIDAVKEGVGSFIANNIGGTVENVYIKMKSISTNTPGTYGKNSSVLAGCTYGAARYNKVFVEYSTPLGESATSGFVSYELLPKYGVFNGVYAIGASKINLKAGSTGTSDIADVYGAYMSYGDYLNAGVNLNDWANDFWKVTNGIPYPSKLPDRVAKTPVVSTQKYAIAGSTCIISGMDALERVIIEEETAKLGVKAVNNTIVIPASVKVGDVIKFEVQSVFDSSKKTSLEIIISENKEMTLSTKYQIGMKDSGANFTIDLSSIASEMSLETLTSVKVGSAEFAYKLYNNGVLTLDRATLTELGDKTIIATFENSGIVLTVKIPVTVYTMVISNADELDLFRTVQEEYRNGHYILENDINYNKGFPAGGANSETAFTGTFDGQGYSIIGMTINGGGAIRHQFLGNKIGDEGNHTGIIKNVSFLNAKKTGKGGFIANYVYGTIENVYIQMGTVTGPAADQNKHSGYSAAIAGKIFNGAKINKVIVEYTTPLSNAEYGYPVYEYNTKYDIYNGLYLIGADKYCVTTGATGSSTTADAIAAYANRNAMKSAGIDFSSWNNNGFWVLKDGIPTPKNLAN